MEPLKRPSKLIKTNFFKPAKKDSFRRDSIKDKNLLNLMTRLNRNPWK